MQNGLRADKRARHFPEGPKPTLNVGAVLKVAYASVLWRPRQLILLGALVLASELATGLIHAGMGRSAVWRGAFEPWELVGVLADLVVIVTAVIFWAGHVRVVIDPDTPFRVSSLSTKAFKRLVGVTLFVLSASGVRLPMFVVWPLLIGGSIQALTEAVPWMVNAAGLIFLVSFFVPDAVFVFVVARLLPFAATIGRSDGPGVFDSWDATRPWRGRAVAILIVGCWAPWLAASILTTFGGFPGEVRHPMFAFYAHFIPYFPLDRLAEIGALYWYEGRPSWPFGAPIALPAPLSPDHLMSWLGSVLRLLAWAVAAGAAAETWRQLHASNSDS